jgi:hypothetical protein
MDIRRGPTLQIHSSLLTRLAGGAALDLADIRRRSSLSSSSSSSIVVVVLVVVVVVVVFVVVVVVEVKQSHCYFQHWVLHGTVVLVSRGSPKH